MDFVICSRHEMLRNIMDERFTELFNIISINDYTSEKEEIETLYENGDNDKNNLLTLVFKDDYPNPGEFTPEVAQSIIDFVEKTDREGRELIIHCWAGISRSGAVAKWINEHFEYNIVYWNNYKDYNRAVHHILTTTSQRMKSNDE